MDAALCIRRTQMRTLCIRRTLCRHLTIGTPMVIFAVLTVFWLFLTVFDEWYTVPIVKNSQNHWCTNRPRSTKTVPTVYQQCTDRQKQSKDSQNSKNDHWCTNHHMSTKTVPTVYQQCTKNSQKTVKTAIMNNVYVSVAKMQSSLVLPSSEWK